MKYTSENGYTGVMEKGNFFGFKHWDFTIYKDNRMVFHSTLSKPYTEEEMKREVDNFPKFLKMLTEGR